jgi:hypothetical protein
VINERAPFSYLVEFDTGTPLGAFSYSLYDEDGNIVTGMLNLQVTPASGAVSILIQIPAAANVLTKPLFEGRLISWSYATALGAVNGSYEYTIRKRVPFPVTTDGVRTKLGIDITEMPDDRIDLLMAYVSFTEQFAGGLAAYETSGDATALKITQAIEALAALSLIDSLQLSLAKRLTSGTNEYERFSKIDWEALRARLSQLVYDTSILVDPTLVYSAPVIFALAVRTDPYTGS